MNVAIIVEGDDDASVYPVFIRRIRNDVGKIHPVQCGGIDVLERKFVSFLEIFQKEQFDISKAIVIRDSDCSASEPLEEKLLQTLTTSGFRRSFLVDFHATKCKLETWLLADERAINQVAVLRGRTTTVREVDIQFEEYRDADKLLRKKLSEVRLPADSKVFAQIAEAADLQRIAERCPHFQQFVDKVRAC